MLDSAPNRIFENLSKPYFVCCNKIDFVFHAQHIAIKLLVTINLLSVLCDVLVCCLLVSFFILYKLCVFCIRKGCLVSFFFLFFFSLFVFCRVRKQTHAFRALFTPTHCLEIKCNLLNHVIFFQLSHLSHLKKSYSAHNQFYSAFPALTLHRRFKKVFEAA